MAGNGTPGEISVIDPLTPKQRKGIAALLSTPAVTAAAEKAGIGVRTLYRWMDQPAFMAELKARQGGIIDQAAAQLVGGSQTALNTLVRMQLGAHSESVRLRAAIAWLEMMHTFREAGDIEDRLTELEKAVKK